MKKFLLTGILCSLLSFTKAQPVVAVNNLAYLGDGTGFSSELIYNNVDFFSWATEAFGGIFKIKSNATSDMSWRDVFTVDFNGDATIAGRLEINGDFLVNGNYRIPGTLTVGTTNPNTGSFKMVVEGKMGAREIQVTTANPWPDYVFEPDYHLPSLYETEAYIKQNGHLPDVPTAEKVKKEGFDVATMNATLLQKIEELTLHMIELKKEVDELRAANQALQKKVSAK